MLSTRIFLAALGLALFCVTVFPRSTFLVQSGEAIRIKSDGSIEGTSYIQTQDSTTYVVTADLSKAVIVEKDSIFLDGNGYSVYPIYVDSFGRGLDLSQRTNVTIRNIQIKGFNCGVWLGYSTNITVANCSITQNYDSGIVMDSSMCNRIVDNLIMNNSYGVWLYASSNRNTIEGNYLAQNNCGVILDDSSNNTVTDNEVAYNSQGVKICSYSANNSLSRNRVARNNYGILLSCSEFNTIFENDVEFNGFGMWLSTIRLGNKICHNSFTDNYLQVYSREATNVWDFGYPFGGNYWSNYSGVDNMSGPDQDQRGSDGIGDLPYAINTDNIDDYPLMDQPNLTPWDIDRDGYCNAKDAVILNMCFGTQAGMPGYQRDADINLDDRVNAKDAVILGAYFGERSQNALKAT